MTNSCVHIFQSLKICYTWFTSANSLIQKCGMRYNVTVLWINCDCFRGDMRDADGILTGYRNVNMMSSMWNNGMFSSRAPGPQVCSLSRCVSLKLGSDHRQSADISMSLLKNLRRAPRLWHRTSQISDKFWVHQCQARKTFEIWPLPEHLTIIWPSPSLT